MQAPLSDTRGCKELRLFSQRRILRTDRKRFEDENTCCHPCPGRAWRSPNQYRHRQAVFARRDKGSRLKITPCACLEPISKLPPAVDPINVESSSIGGQPPSPLARSEAHFGS